MMAPAGRSREGLRGQRRRLPGLGAGKREVTITIAIALAITMSVIIIIIMIVISIIAVLLVVAKCRKGDDTVGNPRRAQTSQFDRAFRAYPLIEIRQTVPRR